MTFCGLVWAPAPIVRDTTPGPGTAGVTTVQVVTLAHEMLQVLDRFRGDHSNRNFRSRAVQSRPENFVALVLYGDEGSGKNAVGLNQVRAVDPHVPEAQAISTATRD